MVRAPPGRFSTTIGWPSTFDISGARMRETVSVALPGACGTTSRSARSGYWPKAPAAAQASSRPAIPLSTSALQAAAHESLALVALHLLVRRLLVAVLHLVLLRL